MSATTSVPPAPLTLEEYAAVTARLLQAAGRPTADVLAELDVPLDARLPNSLVMIESRAGMHQMPSFLEASLTSSSSVDDPGWVVKFGSLNRHRCS